ncbi:MAG TPA: hypothetical protein VMU48_22330 [Terracidiphilus sp.]|nr:hypothetical protein [Terracidiphilus sp.]
MANFTSTLHGDQANALIRYWNKQHKREVKARQWFMAAVALGCLLEAWLYTYFIIWSGDESNDPAKDDEIPDGLVLNDLLDAARQLDLLTPVKFKDKFGKHAVQDVVHEIRHLRNNIHAGAALRKEFDPGRFKKKDYLRLERIFDAVWKNFELAL